MQRSPLALDRRILRCTLLLAAVLAAGCAHVQEPAPEPAAKAGSRGALDSAYDRNEWRWVRNPDGRELLAHNAISKCFVDPRPQQDFNEPGFTLKREQRTLGSARYNVMNVFEGRDFWIAVYQREGSSTPALGVYSDGRCREAAENILKASEKAKGPG
jgi:hypothetical protein